MNIPEFLDKLQETRHLPWYINEDGFIRYGSVKFPGHTLCPITAIGGDYRAPMGKINMIDRDIFWIVRVSDGIYMNPEDQILREHILSSIGLSQKSDSKNLKSE